MTTLGIVKRNITRADKAAVEKLSKFGVATIHEAQGRVGLMKPYMRPIFAGARTCGTAVTVLTHPGDNWMLHVVAEQIQPGDVVVLACTSENNDGMFGDLLATSFIARGCAGFGQRHGRARHQRPDGDELSGVLRAPSTPKARSSQPWAQSTFRGVRRSQCKPWRRGDCRR